MRSMSFRLCLVLIFIPVFSGHLFSDEPVPVLSVEKQMEKLLFEWDRDDRPGGAIVVFKKGDVLFKKAYGLANMEHKVKNTPGTLYNLSAISRVFTAMAVQKLSLEGKLSLDDPVRKYISEFPEFDKSVTVRNLLYQTSGLWKWTDISALYGRKTQDKTETSIILNLIAKQKTPLFEPGSKHELCLTNYVILAEIVKRVSGMSYRDFCWEKIFRPLKMVHTTVYDRQGEPVESMADAYIYNRMIGYEKNTGNMCSPGDTGVISSADDMIHWLKMMDNPDETFAPLKKNMLLEGTLDNGEPIDYASGMSIAKINGLTRYSVSGQWDGYNMALEYYPDQSFAVLVMSNWISGWVDPETDASEISKIYLKDNIKEKDSSDSVTENTNSFILDASTFEKYTGVFRAGVNSFFEIIVKDSKLVFQTSSKRILSLTPVSKDVILMDQYPYKMTYHFDSQGNADSIDLQYQKNVPQTCKRVFLQDADSLDLNELMGNYVNDELELTLKFFVKDNILMLKQNLYNDIAFSPEAKGYFMSDSSIYSLIHFLRDETGAVQGIQLGEDGLFFKKQISGKADVKEKE